MILNKDIIEKQGLSPKEVQDIEDIHAVKRSVMIEMENLNPTDAEDFERLIGLRDKITSLEYCLQAAWRFPQDRNYHRFWELPHCACPRIDNEDRWGTGFYINSAQCVLHGKPIPKE